MNEKLASAKNFIEKHKVAVTATVTAVVTTTLLVAINRKSNVQLGEYLKEHGLYEDYMSQGMYEVE